jgi:hypothetical protein
MTGDGHFSNPELMQLIVADGNADFIFGLPGYAVLSHHPTPAIQNPAYRSSGSERAHPSDTLRQQRPEFG